MLLDFFSCLGRLKLHVNIPIASFAAFGMCNIGEQVIMFLVYISILSFKLGGLGRNMNPISCACQNVVSYAANKVWGHWQRIGNALPISNYVIFGPGQVSRSGARQ
jgi:hypothetical protein